MRSTGDLQYIKKMNKSIVLDIIRQQQPISRAQISVKSGLNKTTVSSMVEELIAQHFVIESGQGASSGGRKPTMLSFNHIAAFAIGIDIQINEIQAVLTDLKGTVIKQQSCPVTTRHPETVAKKLIHIIEALQAAAPASPYGVIGAGIGIPGLIDVDQTVISAPNLGWHNLEWMKMLKPQVDLPLYLDNEANIGALGEKYFGVGKNTQNLVYLSVGTGIGAGIVMQGQLYAGISNFSGEVGHMTIDQQGPVCACGNIGCWETLASERALLAKAAKLPCFTNRNQHKVLDLGDIAAAAEQNDPSVLSLLAEVGVQLGIGLSSLVNILNPEMIIIGNRMAIVGKWLLPSMLDTMDSFTLSSHRQRAQLEFSQSPDHSTALGAAYMAIAGFTKQDPFKTPS